MRNPFRYFNSSPEVIRLAVMMYIRYPLSLRQVEDLLFERGIDICHETVRFWWNLSVANSYSRGDREFEKATAMLFPSEIAQRGRMRDHTAARFRRRVSV